MSCRAHRLSEDPFESVWVKHSTEIVTIVTVAAREGEGRNFPQKPSNFPSEYFVTLIKFSNYPWAYTPPLSTSVT